MFLILLLFLVLLLFLHYMRFHVLNPLLKLFLTFFDHLRVRFVLLILDYREDCIWSLSRRFDLKEWEFVWFGGFTSRAVVEIFSDRTFVKISNNWSGTASIADISKMNWNSSGFGFLDSYFFWKFIGNLELFSIKNLSNLQSNLRNCLWNCLINSMLNFLSNNFSPFAEAFLHAYIIFFHPILEDSTFLSSPLFLRHFILHVFEPLFLGLKFFWGTFLYHMSPEFLFHCLHPSAFIITFSFTAAISGRIITRIRTYIFHELHLHSFLPASSLEFLLLSFPFSLGHVLSHFPEALFLGFPFFFSQMFLHLFESFSSEFSSFTATGTFTRFTRIFHLSFHESCFHTFSKR